VIDSSPFPTPEFRSHAPGLWPDVAPADWNDHRWQLKNRVQSLADLEQRLALTAEEELTTAPGRPPQRIDIRLAIRDGRISGLAVNLLVDVGEGTAGAEDLLRSAGRQALAVYGVPHLRFEATAVRTHRPPTSAPRGADDETAFALECAIDEAAIALDEDPIAFRERQLRRHEGEDPGTLDELDEPPGASDARGLGELLRATAERAGWGRAPRDKPGRHSARRALGVGLARRSAAVAAGSGAAASLRLLEDGSFTLSAVPSSAGGADESAFAAAAASLLGVPTRRVVAAAVDTDSAPFEAGDLAPAFFAAGRAVEQAAELTREKIREAGARLLGVEPAGVELAGGEVRVRGGEAVSVAEVGASALRAGQPLVVAGEGTWSVNTTTGEFTFTPEAGFTSDPSDITYTVDDDEGNTSNPATVSIDYTAQPPVAVDDASLGNPAGPMSLNVIDGAASSGSVAGSSFR